MRFFKKSPRRTIIIGLYIVVFLMGSWIFNMGLVLRLLSLLLLTVLLMGIFYVDCVAILGNLYYGRGKPDKAVVYLRFATSRNTKSTVAYLHYAIYLLRRGGAADAIVLLEKALTLNPKIMALKNIRLTMASCQWVLGDVDKAIETLEQMRRDFDYVNAQVLSTLAYMYFLKGDLTQAEALSQAAIDDTAGTAAAWDNLGQIHYTRGEYAKAREALLKALEYKEDLPDSLYYLGLTTLAEGGEKADAAEHFNRALQCSITPLNTVTREQIEEALQCI